MKNRFIKLCSLLLVLALFVGMLPAEALAEVYGSISTTPSDLTADSSATAQIVEEIKEKRTEYTKQFKMSNGLYVAAVYPDAVHYETEAGWAEIDNTLKVGTGSTYTNTAGVWTVSFPQQLSKSNNVTITKDGYTLSFAMAGELRQNNDHELMSEEGNLDTASLNAEAATASITVDGAAQTFAVNSAQTSTAQIQGTTPGVHDDTPEEMVLDKIASRLQYADVYTNTDIVYDLRSNQVKESIIMEQYNSTLRGYRYFLDVGDMIPVLTEDGQINFYDEKQEEIVMVMPAPFLLDAAHQFSYDVRVLLQQSGDGYLLTYLLPRQWLEDSSRTWPVILDPVVSVPQGSSNIRDHTVMEWDTYSDKWGMLQAGYYYSEGISRFYLKYLHLPELSSADVIVGAEMTLYKYETSGTTASVEVHKVSDVWEAETLTWSNKPDTISTIEDFAIVREIGSYTWNVTDIVRGWYSGKNTGMMFKVNDAVETGGTNNFKQFYSADWGYGYQPSLVISFRNNNGLESYWDYTAHSAGRAGTGYVNNYTGNLVWVHSDIGFGGNRMPVSISHVYNANDKDNDNNDFGMGNGWRTNFNQLVYQWELDSDYYVWEDGDGTKHYFLYDSYGTYKDEDGLELKLTTTGSGSRKFCITDKSGNKSFFDTSGRLTEQQNNQATPSSITVSYSSGNRISQIKDGVGRKYDFTYPGGLLSKISFKGTGSDELSYVSFGYTNSYLTTITDKDGETSTYTYSNGLLSGIVDIDGYQLQYTYSTPTDSSYQPYRVIRVSESDDGTNGGTLNIEYAHNQTTFTDHNGHKQIMQFNDFGNTVSIQDGEGRAQHARYALNTAKKDEDENDDNLKANQMTHSSKLQNTVSNLLSDSSFENSTLWTAIASGVTRSITTEAAYRGNRSLKVVRTATSGESGVYGASITASAGETYTFSAYVKTGAAPAYLVIWNGSTSTYSESLPANSDWTRLEVSYTASGTQNLTPRLLIGGAGTAYLDCVQMEKAPTASRYNLVENGDFRTTSDWSSSSGRTTLTSGAPQLSNNVYQMIGSPTETNRISQTVKVSGTDGDTFVLAGWAKGDSAPLEDDDDRFDREFGIIATFMDSSGDVVNTETARFNPDADSSVSWQYTAVPLVAGGDYASIKIELAYDYNVNTVYFDGIQLYKEQFGNSYTYDEDGNVKSVVDLQKQTTTYEYDNNNLTQMLQDNVAKMTYTYYDNSHNVKTATSAEGLTYEFKYDIYGNNTSVSISSGNLKMTSTATYADGNRLASTTDAAGNVTTYNYNAQTNVLESVQYPNGSGTTTTYTYDDMYRMSTAAASTGSQTLSAAYTYTDDLLTKITTGSTTYDFAYGNFALRSSIKIGSTTLASYTYTDNQNKYLQKLAYGNGDSVQYTYDNYGRVTKETFEDGDTVSYKYDNDGALATITDSATGRTTTYYYDFTDRLMKYVESGSNYSHSVGYSYDDLNNLTKLVETINGTAHTTSYAYDEDNRVTSVTNGSSQKSYTYDGFGRNSSRVSKHGSTTVLTDTITYRSPSSGMTSGQVATLKNAAAGYNTTYTYTYDANGNIKTVNDGSYTTTYTYDNQNQLTREDNQRAGKSWTWTYDDAGNIQSKKEYAYTTGTLGSVLSTKSYGYNNSSNSWGDLLISYNGTGVTYDAVGNPTALNGRSYTWEHGREMATVAYNGSTWTNTYDADGMRTKRTNGSTTYSYVYNGSKLSQMTVGSNTLYFAYDASGTPLSVTYNGTAYYYVTNLHGDVTAILNTSGTAVVTYTYDAWGNILSTSGSMASTLGAHNPLRYRGYVYDTETGLYYLQSRYYDPQVGRFINADAFTSTGQGLLGTNMFAYCGNNPVFFRDNSGTRYCAATTVNGESAEDRGKACAHQNAIAQKQAFRREYAEELAVLEGRSSYYEGIKVVRIDNDLGSFSFGVIHLNSKELANEHGVQTLRHEYGHTVQLKEYGVIGYTLFVAVPSVIGCAMDRHGKLDVDYYSLPWEFEAEMYGKVQGRGTYENETLLWYILYKTAVLELTGN